MKVANCCKLCGEYKPLVKSHIIPDWAYKPLFNEKSQLLKVTIGDKKLTGYIPSGEYEKLLCNECEVELGKLDEYGRAIIYSEPEQTHFGIETQAAEYGANIINVDYSRMKLFQLSILWRSGISGRDFFSNVKIGEHEPVIREMIVNSDPGDAITYGCVMGAIRSSPRELLDQIIDQPANYSENGWEIVRFFFAGCVWLYVLCEDAFDFPLRKFFLAPGAPLPMHLCELQDIPGLVERLRRLGEQI